MDFRKRDCELEEIDSAQFKIIEFNSWKIG
jgi:hypothetical protein